MKTAAYDNIRDEPDETAERAIPAYCVQNDGDCRTCSLRNYGRDCRNNPISDGTQGGPLPGGPFDGTIEADQEEKIQLQADAVNTI
jgi:hypothetical protein